MPKSLVSVTKDALGLPRRQRLTLAELLLGSAEPAADPAAEAAWDSEILDRIAAIGSGKVAGVSCDDVRRAADRVLNR